jgi:hypothetical protein
MALYYTSQKHKIAIVHISFSDVIIYEKTNPTSQS